MQILEVVVYGYGDNARNSVPLYPNRVNLIIGPNSSGKSSIGKIIEYCLGREKFIIPRPGPMDYCVKWYGIKIQIGNEEIFIARQNPDAVRTTYSSFIKIGNKIDTPRMIERPNTSIELVAKTISSKLGIIPGLKLPWPTYLRPQQVGIKESASFCFQYQDEAQSSTSLFHKIVENSYWSEIIKHTFPYFLGSIPNEKAISRFELLQLEREITSLTKRSEEIKLLRGVGSRKARRILSESKNEGIINDNTSPSTFEEYVDVLDRIANWTPDEIIHVGQYNLEELQDNSIKLRNQLTEINKKINIVKNYRTNFADYEKRIKHQEFRLKPIGLVTDLNGESKKCPLCSTNLETETLISKAIKDSLIDLTMKLNDVTSEISDVDVALQELSGEKEEIVKKIQENFEDINAIFDQNKIIKAKYDDNMRRARVSAKASFWLESIRDVNANEIEEELDDKIYLKTKMLEDLKFELIDDKTAEILNEIDVLINEWSTKLKLELSNYYLKLNPKTLQFQFYENSRLKTVTNTAGENWLGYHLVTMLALHRLFVAHKRPVPNFLFFDQPSQVYYSTKDHNTDEHRIEQLYDFLFEFESKNKIQLIISDHANFKDKNSVFKDHISKEFTETDKLIPHDWLRIDQVNLD